MSTGFLISTVAAFVAFLSLLMFGMGIVGTVGNGARKRDYRTAVGAQQPRGVVLPNGVKIAYTDSGGSGTILICLHAIGHGARDFEDLTRRLGPQYRVLALDFPGHGNSGPDVEPASATRYAELLSQFIDDLNLDSAVLIGNSIGGATSIRYTSTHPQRVRALILCNTGGLGQPSLAGRVFIGAFVQFFAAGRRGAFWFPSAFEKYYKQVLIMEPARDERDRIIRSAYEISSPLEQAWRSFGKPEENLLPLLPSIQCPVLLAWAKQDFVVPLKRSESSFQLFRNYRLKVFQGGHTAFLEDPDHFERCIRQFLTDVEGRS